MKRNISSYSRLKIHPLGGIIGAVVEGVDLSEDLGSDTFAEIRQAMLDFYVIFFENQKMTAGAIERLGARFAPLCLTPYSVPIAGHDFATRFVREADLPSTVRNIGDRWHSDQSPRERPNMGAILYCVEAPPYGGDTLFASLIAAYDFLSPELKARCEPLVAIHSPSGVFGKDGKGGAGTRKPLNPSGGKAIDETILKILAAETEHPLIRTHPETGRPILYVTGDYMIGIKDMDEQPAMALLDELNRHVSKPEFTCRWRWRAGSVAIWDNRCTQHYAVNDYAGFRREMLRVEMEGERPFGPAKPRLPKAEREAPQWPST